MAFTSQTPHIVFFTSSMCFTVPMGEFTRHLVERRGFTATFIVLSDVSESHPQDPYLETLPKGSISVEKVPKLSLDDLSADCSIERRIEVLGERSAPFIGTVVAKLKRTKRVVAFVTEPTSPSSTIDVVKKLGVPFNMFFTSCLTAFSFVYHMPELEAKRTCEYRHFKEPIARPGCVPVDVKDFMHCMHNRDVDALKASVRLYDAYKRLDGIVANSFVELEPEPYKALKEMEKKGEVPPFYAVGPFVSLDGWGDDRYECLKFLDRQPDASVLYIAYGIGGTLSRDQMAELAYGLEQSGQRFVWVVRPPNDKDSSGAFYDLLCKEGSALEGLPDGFLERTKGQGVVVPLWAPQVHILKHRATGGYLTHCGWTSVLESIVSGVPMIAWPLFVEQKINAALLSEHKGGVGVALRAKAGEDDVVRRQEVVKVVKELFGGPSGARVRRRVKELKVSAGKAVAEGGASYEALSKWCESVVAK